MPPRKRGRDAAAPAANEHDEPTTKRRSSRQAAAAAAAASAAAATPSAQSDGAQQREAATARKAASDPPVRKRTAATNSSPATKPKSAAGDKATAKSTANKSTAKSGGGRPRPGTGAKTEEDRGDNGKAETAGKSPRDVTPDPDPATLPAQNPDAARHDGEWYWLLKAEPESRFEGGVDVRFSIDDLRACTKPEGWDGIRNYAARNNLRAMNVGDKAFFYHSNCKTPGIVGTMEIVREYSEDKSARRPGTPYYDPQSTRDKPRWSLVHVEFRRKFAVPIPLPELRELAKPGGPLAEMQLVKQSRLSVSKVSGDEWRALCDLADQKAREAGLEHEDA